MGSKDDLSKLDKELIPPIVWRGILKTIGSDNKEDFYKSCHQSRDIPHNANEKEWIAYIRSNPDPGDLAKEIIKESYNYESLVYILCLSRRANPLIRKETIPQSEYGQELAYHLLMNYYELREYKLITQLLPSINHDQAFDILAKHIMRLNLDKLDYTGEFIKKYNLQSDMGFLLAINDLPFDIVEYFFDNNLVRVEYPYLSTSLAIKNNAVFFMMRLYEKYPKIVTISIKELGIENYYNKLRLRSDYMYYQDYFNKWYFQLKSDM